MAFTKILGPGIATDTNVQVGILTAIKFYGDGSELDGITSAGLGTAVEAESLYGGEQIYYTNTVLGIGGTVTVDPPDSTNVAYTQYVDIAVDEDADLIIGDGDDLVLDILGIGTEGVGLLPGNGGRVRADTFTNKAGTGAPNFPNGLEIGDGSFETGFLEIPNTLNVSEDKTISGSSTSKVIVQQQAVVVDSTKILILGPDAELVINAFQI